MSKTVRRNAFEFDYQYEQEKRAQRKEQRQSRQLRQTKHSRFDFLNAE